MKISPYHILLAITLILGYLLGNNLCNTFLLYCVFYLAVEWRAWLNIALCAKRDLRGIWLVLSLEWDVRREMRHGSTIGSIFHRRVIEHPYKIAFVDVETDRKWTFLEFDQFTNQIANYFHQQGVGKDRVVALCMTNCVEYVAFWLAISKLGAVASLINYNLRLQSLGHCLSSVDAKLVIISADMQSSVKEAIDSGHIDKSVRIYVYGKPLDKFNAINIATELPSMSKLLPTIKSEAKFTSVLLYFFTSGTTGMPKAAVITHARFFMIAQGVHHSMNVRESDVHYITMPLYHGGAGMVIVGQTLLNGCTCVIRKKFSASRFWDDCVKYDCTVFHYIGEICRYLLAQPHNENETRHRVRLILGNGLRIQLWQKFVERFKIKQVGEFYGSTEGNAGLVNNNNQVGACGFFPIAVTYPFFCYLRPLYPITLIKIDDNTGEVVRGKDGLCVYAGPGESGEIVGKIIKGNPVKEFIGYLSPNETKKKVIRDVFSKGDMAFASGDILYMDDKGYLYFKDRIGDTFRWKGENVSTTEVEGIIHNIIGLNDAVVFGVETPHNEGKAGMAAIKIQEDQIDLKSFNKTLKEVLPSYARPVFIRICQRITTTGTYKFKKDDLQKLGFDPKHHVEDVLYYKNTLSDNYEILTKEIYEKILNGLIKF